MSCVSHNGPCHPLESAYTKASSQSEERMSHLKVVGKIEPPEYKDPATMLRNIADMIDSGEIGTIDTVVVGISGEEGFDTYAGGPQSELAHAGFVFAACATRLQNIPWGGE
jgi:hypothetical protein